MHQASSYARSPLPTTVASPNYVVEQNAALLPSVSGASKLVLEFVRTRAGSMLPQPAHSYAASGVLAVERGTTLSAALAMLAQHRVLSMPVVTKLDGRFFGFLDMLDVVAYATMWLGDRFARGTEVVSERTWTDFGGALVGDAIKLKKFHAQQFDDVSDDSSLFHVLEMMARAGLLRVAVVNADREIVSIITQSMLLEFVYARMHLLSRELLRQPVSDMMLRGKCGPMRLVGSLDQAMVGFQTMRQSGINALGVVDRAGVLVDVLSARDLRGLDSVWKLRDSVADLKGSLRATDPAATPPALVAVRAADAFEDVLRLLVTHKLHQVFVIDETGCPLACVRITDVLVQLLDQLVEREA